LPSTATVTTVNITTTTTATYQVLDELINKAMSSRTELDIEDLENRNYDKVNGIFPNRK